MINICLAGAWLILGTVFLILDWRGIGKNLRLNVWGIAAFVLCLYNLVRWWATRSNAALDRSLQETRARQGREPRRDHSEPYRAPDPNFNFNEPPAP